MEGRGFRDLAGEFEKKNAVILGVSFDGVDENAAFAAKFDFPFRLLCDTQRALGIAYGACETERNEHARRISYVIGPDGAVRRVFSEVDARTHPAEVLRLL